MSVLWSEINRLDGEAARLLRSLEFHTDSQIRSLTREDLHELFPGHHKLRLRKSIFGIIHRRKPFDVLLRELRDFIPRESLSAALTSDGVLVDYLHALKEMKTQVNNVETFLDAHISLLEDLRKNQNQGPNKDLGSVSGLRPFNAAGSLPYENTLSRGDPAVSRLQLDAQADAERGFLGFTSLSNGFSRYFGQTNRSPRHAQASHGVVTATVRYKMLVTGKTFDAHTQLLDKIRTLGAPGLELTESSEDHQVIIVFCPIVSRIGTDVENAMSNVTDLTKPVILVLMHHTRTAVNTPERSWPNDASVVLHVSVFYHDTMRGLLTCPENDNAASQMRGKLLQYGS